MTTTALDEALIKAQSDADARSAYYEAVLNTEFYLPTLQAPLTEEEAKEAGKATPLIAESEGKEYLMLFETQQRMLDWAGDQPIGSIKLPGHMLAELSTEGLHWALNTGCEHQRIFVPDEISWLQKVVARCKEEKTPSEGADK